MRNSRQISCIIIPVIALICLIIALAKCTKQEAERRIITDISDIVSPDVKPEIVIDGTREESLLATTEGPSWINQKLHFSNYIYGKPSSSKQGIWVINSDKTLGEIMSNPEDNSEEHLNEEEIQKTKELNNNQEQIETQNNSEIQNNIETTNIKQENNIESEKIEAQLNPETETIIEINEESNQTNNQEQIEPSLEQQETETQQQEIKQTNSEEIEKQEKDNDFII